MLAVDHNMANELSAVKSPQYICSPEGRILGHYVPVEGTIFVEDLKPGISEEEMRRRAESGDGLTTAEVLARLKSRERK